METVWWMCGTLRRYRNSFPRARYAGKRIQRRNGMKWTLLFLALAGSIPAATIRIDPSTTNVLLGTPFTVDLSITSVVDLYAFQSDIGFNPAVLSAVGVTPGSFLGGANFLPGIIDNTTGTISFIGDSLTGVVPGNTGSGTLATITFLAL